MNAPAAATAWLTVLGIGADGPEGVPPAARALISSAEVLVGGERHLALAGNSDAEQIRWSLPLEGVMDAIAAHRGRRVVVLATGDPMAFGIGATLARHFTPAEMTILPAPGAFSLAASRLAWPLQSCVCMTLHGRPLELVNAQLLPGARLLILSHDGTTPATLAAHLRDVGYGASRMTVLVDMGTPEEQRIDATARDWPDGPVGDLNTIAVDCVADAGTRPLPRVSGLPDDAFEHDGQMTKRVVRAATLAALAPVPGQTLWDLGAGSGSVAIEWLRAAQDVQGQGARAVAVERDGERAARIARNADRLGTPFLEIVQAEIAAALPDLPDPDSVFLGGGLTSSGIVDAILNRLAPGGRLVANAVTIEGEAVLLAAHAAHGGELTRIAVSQADAVGARTGWRAAMPVTQWSHVKP